MEAFINLDQDLSPGILPQGILDRLIDTGFDPDKSTPKAVILIWNADNYRIEISYDGIHIEIEEVCYYDGETYISYILSESQNEFLTTIAENYREGYMDEVADLEEYNRDIYAYHGMSRSDF